MKAYHAHAGKLMDLLEAAERAVVKLDYEYQRLGIVESESWAEADRLREAIEAFRTDMAARLT